ILENAIKNKSLWLENLNSLKIDTPLNIEEYLKLLNRIRDEIIENKELNDEEIIEKIPMKPTEIEDIIKILVDTFQEKVPEYEYKDWLKRLNKIWKLKKINMYFSKLDVSKSNNNETQSKLQKRIIKTKEKGTNNKPFFILDGSNVARNRKNQKTANLNDITLCRNALIEKDIPKENIYIIFGSSLYHHINKQQKEKWKELLEEDNVNQAPAGRDDDWFIIKFAERNKAYIITNDLYRDHKREHPEILNFINYHLIGYTLLGDEIMFDENFNELMNRISN
ncbi:MAG: hypothetical protein GF364_06935, partial [Candidatus Lokiarchaeota archaeon]|nr:hypothetical protein [Candidatus Lokiarchaeota archaeon]